MRLAVGFGNKASLAAMRRLLLTCLLTLTACTPSPPGSGPATGEPGALAAEEISVTPLAPPGAAPQADPDADAPPPEEPAPAATGAPAGPATEDPAGAATAAGETTDSAGEAVAAEADAVEAAPAAEPAPPLSPEAKACERRNGTWAKTPSGGNVCIRRTRDGGQSCTRESQCEGLCLARSGTCAPITPVFGCNDILQDDGRRVTLCLD